MLRAVIKPCTFERMIRYGFTLLLILLCGSLVAQQQNTFELIGTMIPDGMRPMTYKVVFQIEGAVVKGYTLSDIGGAYETKARIRGTYQEKSKRLQFTESDIVYTKYKNNSANMCMPNISGKLSVKQGKTWFEGNYTGQFNGTKKTCGGGAVYLMSAKDLYAQLSGVAKKMASMPQADTTLQAVKVALSKIQPADEVRDMQANDYYSVAWESNDITLEIWDDGVEDNDRIHILSIDSSINESILIRRNKQVKTYTFPKNKNSIMFSIRAENEGNYIPNTVKIVLVDKTKRYMILSRLNKDEKVRLNLFHKK